MRALQFAFPITLALSLAGVASAQTALQLRWELKGDVFRGPTDDGAAKPAFTLTNRDAKPLPARGWAIYFNALHEPLPGTVQGGVAIERVTGDAGILFHHRRHLDDGQILFLVNTSVTSPSAGTIVSDLNGVERWDLLAYTNLGKPKYHRLDLPYRLEVAPLLTRGEMERIWSAAVEIVPTARWSGATRPER